jgi:phenylacetate-CoA ligase
VPYYHRLFDSVGFNPSDFRDIRDLEAIPITSKADLQQVPIEDRVARGVDCRRLILRKTGGSTGEQMKIQRTWFEERLLNAFRFRARRDLGLRLTDHVASVGLALERQAADRQILTNVLGSMGFLRVTKVDCRQSIDRMVQQLEEISPDVITGYANTVARIAEHICESGRRTIRPRFVTTGAEVQTPLMRRQIAEAFEAPVYNVYGCHEFNMVACECPKTGKMHTCDDLAVIEVVRGNDPVAIGQRGEVVGTSLHSYAMPFIRYRLHDVVTRGAEQCACGSPFSTIDAVQGRMLDFFPLANGRVLHPYEIIDAMLHDRMKWMRQYQLVQPRQNLVVLRVVLSKMPTQERLDQMHVDARRLMGEGTQFQLEFVPAIPAEPNGKFRLARSLVHSNYEGFDWARTEHA